LSGLVRSGLLFGYSLGTGNLLEVVDWAEQMKRSWDELEQKRLRWAGEENAEAIFELARGPVDFEFSERESTGRLPQTTQGVILQHLRDRVLSQVVCSSLGFGHSLGQRWLPTAPEGPVIGSGLDPNWGKLAPEVPSQKKMKWFGENGARARSW
jgi:hypothetical protein